MKLVSSTPIQELKVGQVVRWSHNKMLGVIIQVTLEIAGHKLQREANQRIHRNPRYSSITFLMETGRIVEQFKMNCDNVEVLDYIFEVDYFEFDNINWNEYRS